MDEMECGCMSDACEFTDGAEPLEFFTNKIIKVRKEHRCCECRRIIKIDELAEYYTCKYDGVMDSGYTCIGCYRMAEEYACGCRVYGALSHQIWGVLGINIETGEIALDDDEPPYENSPGCPW